MPLHKKRKRHLIHITAQREESKALQVQESDSDDEELLLPSPSVEVDGDPEDCFIDIDVVDDQSMLSFTSLQSKASVVPSIGQRPPIYTSSSIRTQFRRAAEKRQLAQSAGNTRSIQHYFSPITTPQSIDSEAKPRETDSIAASPSRDEDDDGCSALPPEAAITLLDCLSVKADAVHVQNTRADFNVTVQFLVKRTTAVRAYLLKWAADKNSFKRIAASQHIAQIVYGVSSTNQYRGKLIRYWALYFLQHGEFPPRTHGCHAKVFSFILDEDVQHECRTFLRSLTPGERLGLTQKVFSEWVNSNIPTVHISTRTASKWLHQLGYHCRETSKGIYVDGHERPDVVQYRGYFCRLMMGLKRKIATITDADVIQPDLQPNEKELVLVVHDECTFAAHDGRKYIWVEDGKPPLRPKGDGHVIMVSQFLCACHGSLTISFEEAKTLGLDFTTAGEIIYPGKHKDGYWTNQDLVNQLQTKAIPLFNYLHPNKTAIFAFDNSQNHHAMADNALIASRLNLSDGLKAASGGSRKRVIMRNGYYYDDDDNKIIQSMINEDGGQKGIKRILLDRGLWREGIKLDQARELLNNEPDFIEQSRTPWLKEIVTKANHMFIFFPKFHPEFNFIERYWGLAKRYARSKCSYSFKELEKIVPESILSISLTNIRRFYNHSWRYIEAYHTGNLQPHQVEWAMKKYTSHRRIRETDPDIVLPGFLTPEFSQEMPR
jgi:hypothetical protein